METITAIILGIIEGLTEFLPVSSTGHLIIASDFLSFNNPEFENMFNIVIQFGAILAVVFFFWDDIFPFTKNIEKNKKIFRRWGIIIVGFLPAAVIGVFIDDLMEYYLFNPASVATALIVGSILIFIAESIRQGKLPIVQSPDEITIKLALGVGLFQCLAMWPGMSRSASTIIGAIFLGFSRQMAAQFSFMLGIPTIMGASCFKLLKTGFDFTSFQWMLLGIGTAVSFFIALIVIKFFMSYLGKYSLKPFAIYRVMLGITVLVYCL